MNAPQESFGVFATGILIFGFVAGVCWKANDVISNTLKEAISDLVLGRRSIKEFDHWLLVVTTFFEIWFGKRHISLRCVVYSCITSLCSLFLFVTIHVLLNLNFIVENIQILKSSFYAILLLLSFGALMNLVPDYISLLETRLILEKINASRCSISKILFYLIFDFVLTSLIFWIYFILIVASFVILFTNNRSILDAFYIGIPRWASIVDAYNFNQDRDSGINIGVFLYTTCVTSIWIWIFISLSAVVLVLKKIDAIRRPFELFLNFRGEPVKSLGVVLGIFSALAYWAMTFIMYLS